MEKEEKTERERETKSSSSSLCKTNQRVHGFSNLFETVCRRKECFFAEDLIDLRRGPLVVKTLTYHLTGLVVQATPSGTPHCGCHPGASCAWQILQAAEPALIRRPGPDFSLCKVINLRRARFLAGGS
jgi:hypothetical protein